MLLDDVRLLPAVPEPHFAAIAALISTQETEPSTQQSLTDWYNRRVSGGIRFTAAVDQRDQLLGFNGLYRDNTNVAGQYGVYLVVDPPARQAGLGRLLYADLLSHAAEFEAQRLRTRVRDTCDAGLQFALHRGFAIVKHSIEMMFDLSTFDESHYQPILQALESQGFRFTNMSELGDTADARRKLFALNNSAAATDPGSDGIPPWATFEEFERDVCCSDWYHPDAQIVAIDTRSGDWAAMSAITVFEGSDHAYNLFTGTDVRYRGRKLAQAVKSLALRRAREFGVDKVRTSHNSENAAMIAIDTKLGYVRTPGTFVMVKDREND